MTDPRPGTSPLGSRKLAELHQLLERTAATTDNPSWSRTLRAAAHVTTLMAGPAPNDPAVLAELRRRLADVRAALDDRRSAETAEEGSSTWPPGATAPGGSAPPEPTV